MLTLKDYVNWGLTHCDKTASAEGVPLVLENCKKNKKMKQFEVYGESVQIGGKNMLNPDNVFPSNSVDYVKNGATFTIRGAEGGSAFANSAGSLNFSYYNDGKIEVKNGKTYTLSFDYELIEQGIYNNRIGVYVYSSETNTAYASNYSSFVGVVGESVRYSTTFTSKRDDRITVSFRLNNNYVKISNVQFEEGSTATEYEPFIYPSPETPVEVESVGELAGIMLDKDLYGDLSLYSVEEYYTAYKTMYIEGLKPDTPYYVTVNRLNGSQVNTVKTIMVISGGTFSVASGYYSTLSHTSGSADYNFSPHTTDSEGRLTIGVSKSATQEQLETILSNVDVYFAETKEEADNSSKYKIPVTVRGKNLFNKSNLKNFRYNGCSWAETSTGVVIKSTANPSGDMSYVHLDLGLTSEYAGKTITATMKAVCVGSETYNNTMFVTCNSDSSERVQKGTKSFVTEDNITYITLRYTVENLENKHLTLRLYVNNVIGSTNYEFNEIMVSESETPILYEPYIEPQTTNIYLNEPLRKIGDYADVIDSKNKKVLRKIHEPVFDGAESWVRLNTADANLWGFMIYKYYPYIRATSYVADCSLCNMYPVVKLRTDKTLSGQSSSKNRFDFIDLDYADVDAWKAHLAELNANGTPLKIAYALELPYEETIECELPILETKTSIVEVATSLLPSNIKGKYIKK